MVLSTLHKHCQGFVVPWSSTDHLVVGHIPLMF